MRCPVCKEVRLVLSERQGIDVDYCPQCRGIWLDRNELDKIIERTVEVPLSQGHDGPLEPVDGDHEDHSQGSRRRQFLEELLDFS